MIMGQKAQYGGSPLRDIQEPSRNWQGFRPKKRTVCIWGIVGTDRNKKNYWDVHGTE